MKTKSTNYHASENSNLIRCTMREAQKKMLRFCTDGKRSFAALRYLLREAQKKLLRFCTDGKQAWLLQILKARNAE